MAGGRRPNTGGARPGAGRKKGVPNKTTKAVKERVLKSGKTPLEMMVEIARYHFTDFLREARKQTKNRDEAAIMTKSKAALDAAEKAAPYMHTRMKAVEVTGKGGGPIQTVDLTKMSDDDLNKLEALLRPLANIGGDPGGEDEEEG